MEPQIRFCTSADGTRIAHTNIYLNPQEGDHVLIEAVLNVITEIKKKE